MCELFFVYGTLKRGYNNNKLLKDSKYLGTAVSEEKYLLLDCGFPMAVLNEAGLPVLGEVFEVTSKEAEASLDWLESNGCFYTRSKRRFTLEGNQVEAWIYEVPDGYGVSCPVHPNYNAYWWYR